MTDLGKHDLALAFLAALLIVSTLAILTFVGAIEWSWLHA